MIALFIIVGRVSIIMLFTMVGLEVRNRKDVVKMKNDRRKTLVGVMLKILVVLLVI